MTDEEASAVKLEDYFEGWTPAYYKSGDVKPEPVAADYTAVDEAIKAAEALNKDDYEDFSAVTKAIEAVDRTLTSEDQAKVDAMAKAITDAINGLVKKQPVVNMLTQVRQTSKLTSMKMKMLLISRMLHQ